MPSERPIAPSIVLISLSDFLPKFFVLSSSASVFGTRSAMVRMFAALKQLDARPESSSSSTLRTRFSFRSVRGRVEQVLPDGSLLGHPRLRALEKVRRTVAAKVRNEHPIS